MTFVDANAGHRDQGYGGELLSRLRRYVLGPGVIDPYQGVAAEARAGAMLPARPVDEALDQRWRNAVDTGGPRGPIPSGPIVYPLADTPYRDAESERSAEQAQPPGPESPTVVRPLRVADPLRPGDGRPDHEAHRPEGQLVSDPAEGGYHEPVSEPLPVVTGRTVAPDLVGPRPTGIGEPDRVDEPSIAYTTPLTAADPPSDRRYGDQPYRVEPYRTPEVELGQPYRVEPYRTPEVELGQPYHVQPPADLPPGRPYEVLPYEPTGRGWGRADRPPWPGGASLSSARPEPVGPRPLPHPLARGQFLPASDQPSTVDPGGIDERLLDEEPSPDDDRPTSFEPFDDDDDEGTDRPPLDEADLTLIVDRVQRHLARRLEVERERRGRGAPWL